MALTLSLMWLYEETQLGEQDARCFASIRFDQQRIFTIGDRVRFAVDSRQSNQVFYSVSSGYLRS